jgi:hypothetical protein
MEPSGSTDPRPSRITSAGWETVWSGPALARGVALLIVTVVETGGDDTRPSLTTSVAHDNSNGVELWTIDNAGPDQTVEPGADRVPGWICLA